MLNLYIKIVRAVTVCLTLVFLINTLNVQAQTSDTVTEMASRINRERIARGLTPYALNAQLSAAAQAHANDLAKSGKIRTPAEGHIGADGSNVFERVARTSYGAYSWGRRLGENWAHYRDGATAYTEWMESLPHRANILHALYREIGIGVAPSSLGGYIYIVDFGAQPNVLPFFIDANATETRSIDVTLTLNDELVQPNGDGASNIGHPVEVQISNSSDFSNAKWQLYAPKINWTLTPSAGTKTVHVKYRDAKGRTATAYRFNHTPSIEHTDAGATRTNTRTPQPSIAVTITRTLTPTEIATLATTATQTIARTPIPSIVMTGTRAITSTEIATIAPTATPSITPAPTQTTSPTIVPNALLTDDFIGGASSAAIGAIGLATVIVILMAVLKDIVDR